MPVSVPRHERQLPVYYSQEGSRDYMDGEGTPLYAFGYGLSYTNFEYGDLELKEGNGKDTLQVVSCRVTNTGEYDGHEVVQLYVTDKKASVSLPPVLLKGFRHVALKRGESKKVIFVLGKEELALYDTEMKQVVEPGEFEVKIGAASDDIRLKGVFRVK